jgi:glycyl-tRNA synthetase beta chain
MPDFLLELLSEEIPARMQARAREDLARLFAAEIANAGLSADRVETYATPRRLALIARGLPLGAPATAEELKGPRTSAPPHALEGFLRKTGLTQDQLEDRGGVWFARIDKPGRATTEVLAEAIPAIVRAFPWPKSMRWGAASLSTESLRWVRPLQGIVAMLDEELIDLEIGPGASPAKVGTGFAPGDATTKTLRSSAATIGHRFHHPGPITLAGASDYVEKLKACHVIVDPDERARIIREGAEALAAAQGLALVPDEGLVQENAGLTEWPVPLLGTFDAAFLEVQREVIQLTMRTNQKYFAATDGAGKLAPAFICVANIAATDGGARIVAGNQKVLAARLSDARFFWEQDLKVPLEDQARKLGQIVFHEKLGTVADKVERVAKLARWLVEEGIVGKAPPRNGEVATRSADGGAGSESFALATPPPPTDAGGPPPRSGEDQELAALAERAARLCKADLVTQMVGEFPELQGLIGGYLAAAQGEDPQVAAAISDHYKPVGQGDEVPTAPVTVAVSLADKLDTLAAFFMIEERPTGSKDPYALRRAGIGLIKLIIANQIRTSIWAEMLRPVVLLREQLKLPEWEAIPVYYSSEVNQFVLDRLKVQQREAGVRHDLIDAVFALGGEDDLVRLLARVRALQAFVETPEGADLLAGYKRAANILKKEGWPPQTAERRPGLDPGQGFSSDGAAGGPAWDQDPGNGAPEHGTNKTLSYRAEKEEKELIAALDAAEPRAAEAIAAEDFEGAMAALATLRKPVDAFFDKVTVNDPEAAKRTARLDLLLRMRAAFHGIADFSKIEG